MKSKFDILDRFIYARDPALWESFDIYLDSLTNHQIEFVYWAVEVFRGSAYVPEMADPSINTKDLIDPYLFVQEPVRACKEAISRVYDPEANYEIREFDQGFPFQILFRHVMPRRHSYDMKTGVFRIR